MTLTTSFLWILFIVSLLFIERVFDLTKNRSLADGCIYNDLALSILSAVLIHFLYVLPLSQWVLTYPLPTKEWFDHSSFAFLTITLIFFFDFLSYLHHRFILHLFPIFKRSHELHHSSEHLDVLSGLRTHALDLLPGPPTHILLGFWLGAPFTAIIAAIYFQAAVQTFAHTNVRWNFGVLNYLIVNPQYHRAHHEMTSFPHGVNYATVFPIWDLIFGTFVLKPASTMVGFKTRLRSRFFLWQLLYPFTRRFDIHRS